MIFGMQVGHPPPLSRQLRATTQEKVVHPPVIKKKSKSVKSNGSDIVDGSIHGYELQRRLLAARDNFGSLSLLLGSMRPADSNQMFAGLLEADVLHQFIMALNCVYGPESNSSKPHLLIEWLAAIADSSSCKLLIRLLDSSQLADVSAMLSRLLICLPAADFKLIDHIKKQFQIV